MKRLIMWASAIALIIGPAFSQTASNCAPRNVVAEKLQNQFGEGVHAQGLQGQASQATIVEWWGSSEKGSWTITVTSLSGITCIVASGRLFEAMTPPAIVKDDPA